MAQQRLAMQKNKEVLRLHLVGGIESRRQIARAVGCGKSAVSDCLRRARLAGLTDWAQIGELDELELSRRLYCSAGGSTAKRAPERPLPDWARVREELARRDHQVTLALLWEEYKAEHPEGYQYSQFAELYRRFEKRLSVVLRQPHRAGEKCFVDFCDGLAVIDPNTGDRIETQLFVGALEAAVLVAQRWILAVLRHRRFYHLEDLNAAIEGLCAKLNDRVMRHVKQSRRALYERLDRPALKTLPAEDYEYAEWKKVGVNIDYHIAFDEHFYSVPYTLVGESMWVRATGRTVELIHRGKRITTHVRSFVKYDYSTYPEHRPASHRAHLEWTPSRLIGWGKSVGVHTAAVIEHVIRSKPPSRAGLSLGAWDFTALPALHPGPARTRLRPCTRYPLPALSHHQNHAQAAHGECGDRRRGWQRPHGRARCRERARATLLPLTATR